RCPGPQPFAASWSRRRFLQMTGHSFGAMALAHLLAHDAAGSALASGSTTRTRGPHFAPRAKRVIFLFMVGGPSQMDLFDPKPGLEKSAGKPLPEGTGRPKSQFTSGGETVLASTRKWNKHGQSGADISDLMPHLATCADDLC